MAARRVRAGRGAHRPRYLTIDLDSLPVEVHGEQPGSEYNGHYHCRIYHPLIASVAGTGDLLDVQLHEGTAYTWLPAESTSFFPLLDDVERELCQVAAVRIDAGFPEENLLSALEGRGTPYVAAREEQRCAQSHGGAAPQAPGGAPSQGAANLVLRAELSGRTVVAPALASSS